MDIEEIKDINFKTADECQLYMDQIEREEQESQRYKVFTAHRK